MKKVLSFVLIFSLIFFIFFCSVNAYIFFQLSGIKQDLSKQNYDQLSKRSRKILWSFKLVKPVWLLYPGIKDKVNAFESFNYLLIDFNELKNSSTKLLKFVLNDQKGDFNNYYFEFQQKFLKAKKDFNATSPLKNFLNKDSQKRYENVNNFFNISNEFISYFPEIFGLDQEKTYYILLQNNFELRPTGGFMGSYAKVKFNKGILVNLSVQDIYVPDGQINGHVDPPWPIQFAFKQGWWRLRDSNWDPDFPTAASQISWFFEKGKEEPSDGVIALNFIFIKDLIKMFEPIKLTDYSLEVNSENFYQITQNEVEKNFFPGSTQKKDFLTDLTNELFFKIKDEKNLQFYNLAKVLLKNLNEKQILIFFKNPELEKLVNDLKFNGSIKTIIDYPEKNAISDYIYIVDTNLGANKANCCIERRIIQEINLDSNFIEESLTINYKNNGSIERPSPPLFWGGIYQNFVRIILPFKSENHVVTINDIFLDPHELDIVNDEFKNLKTVGFFVEVPPLKSTKVKVKYSLPIQNNFTQYYLDIRKEPGLVNNWHEIKFITSKVGSLLINIPFERKDNIITINQNFQEDKVVKLLINN